MNPASVNGVDVVPTLLRRMNVRKVLEAFHTHGPLTRAQLTRRTGISPPTVSKLTAQLLEAGLVEQDADPVVTNGRPGILFRLASNRVYVMGVVIDVNVCTVSAAGLDGALKKNAQVTFRTPHRFDHLIAQIEQHVLSYTENQDGSCVSIGLTIPGLINRSSGRIVLSPNMHFLNGKTPGAVLSKRLDIHTSSIQEEHALCLGAQMFGKARGVTDFAVVDLSQGFGMGVVSEGRFLKGYLGYGGEIGHNTVEPNGKLCGCGNRGCLETVATDRALAAACSDLWGEEVEMSEVIRLVKEEGRHLDTVLARTAEYVAIGVASVINIFNPKLILLHGRMFDIHPDLLKNVVARAKERALAPSAKGCTVRRSRADKTTGSVAGAIDSLFSRMGPSMTSF
jgi:N-acetylglucosamine repressor